MIGVKPLFDGEVPEGAEARFQLIGIGADAATEPMKVAWELTRIETRYQWYQYSGNWNWEPVTTRTRSWPLYAYCGEPTRGPKDRSRSMPSDWLSTLRT